MVDDANRTPRVVLTLPTWEQYLSVALDEILDTAVTSVHVHHRLGRLLEELVAAAPPQHREPIERRFEALKSRPL